MSVNSQICGLWEDVDKIDNFVKLLHYDLKSENKVKKLLFDLGELDNKNLLQKVGLEDYSVHLINNESKFEFYRSTLFGLALTKSKEDIGLAVLGFSFRQDSSILIEQIQGSKNSYSAKNLPKEWDSLLTKFSILYFKEHGFTNVWMSKADQEPYFNNPVGIGFNDLNKHKERMLSRYDGVALKLGFTFLPGENKYYLNSEKYN